MLPCNGSVTQLDDNCQPKLIDEVPKNGDSPLDRGSTICHRG